MEKKYIVRLADGERQCLNKIVAKFKGSSQKVRRAQVLLKADADGPSWTDAKIAEAQGDAARFLAVLTEYEKAPAITRKRMYLETMEAVLPDAEKLVVEPGSATVLPYLPLGAAAAKDAR